MRRNFNRILCIMFLLLFTVAGSMLQPEKNVVAQPAQYSGGVTLSGLVNNPINLTDADMLSLPMVSEVARIRCVWENQAGSPPTITVNWTGIPLFHLLTMAQVRSEAYKVVFRPRAPDDFFDTLTIEDAVDPRVILAVKANDTLLTSVSEFYPGHIGGYRIVVPGRWGYKWVANVGTIDVVDSNILGTYETTLLQSDTALIPDEPMTSINPAVRFFNTTIGNRTFQVGVFSNASVEEFKFDVLQNTVSLNMTVPANAIGFADFILQQDILKGPYSIFVDNENTSFAQANVIGKSFQYMILSEGRHAINIVGAESPYHIPMIVLNPITQPVHVREMVTLNASRSSDIGSIVGYEWDFGDGTLGSGAVVFHTYANEGSYQVSLNVTNDQGFSSLKTFQISVESVPIDIALIVRTGLLVSVTLLAFAFAYMVLARKKNKLREQNASATRSTHLLI